MGIGIVYASDRDRAREKVFGVEALAGEMMMMKTKFTDIVLGVKKMTNVSSKNHQGSGVLKIHNHTNNPLAATITPNNPSPPLPCWKQKVNGNNKDCIIITIQLTGNFDLNHKINTLHYAFISLF